MSTELRDFKWAVVAAQHRSLRRAAETLNIKQSTLSRRLREIEEQVGAVLFERTNGGTRPTLEGQEFLEAARRIIEETEGLATRLKTRSRGESGRLAVGVHSSLSAGNLRATLMECRRRLPALRVNLVDGSSDHLVSDLANSAIDIAFVVVVQTFEVEPSRHREVALVYAARTAFQILGAVLPLAPSLPSLN
jgi:DNA-binding transcriptional LysR family regulator